MASLLHCLLRSCFEQENGESQNQAQISYEPPNTGRMARSTHYESTAQGEENESDEEEVGDCCRPEPGAENDSVHTFWRKLFARRYESLEPVEGGDVSPTSRSARIHPTTDAPFQRSAPFGIFRRSSGGKVEEKPSLLTLSQSPLRTASSFRHSKGMPTINPDEVVIPGSALQHEMAKQMSSSLEAQGDECVICMEGFDATNPRMPTLCGCGENKTYFHLPCLYQWIEQSRDCPSCRKRLRWEEF